MKSERIGMAMESVVTVHLWSHVWDALDAVPSDVGSVLPLWAVTGALLPGPIIFLGRGSGYINVTME